MFLSLRSLHIVAITPITMVMDKMQRIRLDTDRESTADFWQIVLSCDGVVPSGQTLHVAPFPTWLSGHSVQVKFSQEFPLGHALHLVD